MHSKVDRFWMMTTPNDVASLLDVRIEVLNYRLHLLSPKYIYFELPKKNGGVRQISSPVTSLKLLQLSLNSILQDIYPPRPSVHGFVKNKSIVTNARPHRKQKYVLNIDLKDFFPSIHFGRVKGLFMAPPFNFNNEVALTLARICSTYDGLPQGAPTSPIISNMICRRMDGSLEVLAKRHQCFYTRYADDITISTSKPTFPSTIAYTVGNKVHIGELLQDILDQNGFTVNEKKIRLQTRHQRQEVTGITVNRFPNVNRKYINQVRAMLHDLENRSDHEALERHFQFRKQYRNPARSTPTSFREIIWGKIEYIGQVRGKRDKVYIKFMKQLGIEVEPEPRIFINYASEDLAEIQKIHDSLKLSFSKLWMDTSEIIGGDEWWPKITTAIDNSHIFIPCITVNSVRKDGIVQREIDYALEKLKNANPNTFFIIPLLVHKGVDVSIHKGLSSLSYVKYYQPEGLTNLHLAVKDHIAKLQ